MYCYLICHSSFISFSPALTLSLSLLLCKVTLLYLADRISPSQEISVSKNSIAQPSFVTVFLYFTTFHQTLEISILRNRQVAIYGVGNFQSLTQISSCITKMAIKQTIGNSTFYIRPHKVTHCTSCSVTM